MYKHVILYRLIGRWTQDPVGWSTLALPGKQWSESRVDEMRLPGPEIEEHSKIEFLNPGNERKEEKKHPIFFRVISFLSRTSCFLLRRFHLKQFHHSLEASKLSLEAAQESYFNWLLSLYWYEAFISEVKIPSYNNSHFALSSAVGCCFIGFMFPKRSWVRTLAWLLATSWRSLEVEASFGRPERCKIQSKAMQVRRSCDLILPSPFIQWKLWKTACYGICELSKFELSGMLQAVAE